ncbi:MAG TPA: hypothetical protein VNW29_03440 [Candidatus Sulfotelmatobacter sp.]|nr:hypothetical protein [Candidatus Sulfotelmatobacter sp.]
MDLHIIMAPQMFKELVSLGTKLSGVHEPINTGQTFVLFSYQKLHQLMLLFQKH